MEITASQSLQVLQPQPDTRYVLKITYQKKNFCHE